MQAYWQLFFATLFSPPFVLIFPGLIAVLGGGLFAGLLYKGTDRKRRTLLAWTIRGVGLVLIAVVFIQAMAILGYLK